MVENKIIFEPFFICKTKYSEIFLWICVDNYPVTGIFNSVVSEWHWPETETTDKRRHEHDTQRTGYTPE